MTIQVQVDYLTHMWLTRLLVLGILVVPIGRKEGKLRRMGLIWIGESVLSPYYSNFTGRGGDCDFAMAKQSRDHTTLLSPFASHAVQQNHSLKA